MLNLEQYVSASGKYPERMKSPELTLELIDNAISLLDKVNLFLSDIGIKNVTVSSGFRPSAVNLVTPGAAAKSHHMTCHAIDILDSNGRLGKLALDNLNLLEKHGLYMEDKSSTISWLHLQDIKPRSGNRVFKP
jgi:hypothetical protein